MKECLTFYQGVFDVIWCWFLLISELLVRRENHHKSCRCICGFFHHRPRKLSLLGLMAKIKCSICSYQFNIWYAGHSLAHILIWFLAFDYGSEVYLTLVTGCLGIALQPSAAHFRTMKTTKQASLGVFDAPTLEYSTRIAHDPRALRVRNPCWASIKGVVYHK